MKQQKWITICLWIVAAVLAAAALAMAVSAIVGAAYDENDYSLRLTQSKEGKTPVYRLFRAASKENNEKLQPLETVDFHLFAMTDKQGNMHLKGAYVLYKSFLALLFVCYALCVVALQKQVRRTPAHMLAKKTFITLGVGLVGTGILPYLFHFVARAALYGRVWVVPQSLFGWATIGIGVLLLILSLLLPASPRTVEPPDEPKNDTVKVD